MILLILIIKALLEISIIALIYLTIALIGIFIIDKVKGYYQNWEIKKRNLRWLREAKESMQRQHKWELKLIAEELKWKLYEEEKRKYPLFFWKENI